MATVAKTIVATGASSGLGFEAIKQLLHQRQRPYTFIIGARNPRATRSAYDALDFDSGLHRVSVLPLDLADLSGVRSFARRAVEDLDGGRLDVLFLNAGMNKAARGEGVHGSSWCEAYVVNHLCTETDFLSSRSIAQHYLTQLFEERLRESRSRVVVVSSGLIRSVKGEDIKTFESKLKADSGADAFPVYAATKFVQFLGAHWWRRRLGSSATVFAVSPGVVLGTGLGRHLDVLPNMDNIPDQLTVEQGAKNLLRAIDQTDFPEDPEQIFLTSWGEWWPKDVYELSLSKSLQDQWCPSKEEIEKEAGITK